MKIAILSNINVDMLAIELRNYHEVFVPGGFDIWKRNILEMNSELDSFKPDVILLLLDGSYLISTDKTIDNALSFLPMIADRFDYSSVFISTLDLWFRAIKPNNCACKENEIELRWNDALMQVIQNSKNIFLFDIKSIIESIGRNTLYSRKLWYLGGCPYSMAGINVLTQKIIDLLSLLNGNRKKCLVLDLDNTIWGGVIGEDGIDGIVLSSNGEGARFYDFQKRIKELKNHGILITVVSKNNMEDVMAVFKKHPYMVLSEKDIVRMEVNWNPKSQNIVNISKALNIGLDSMIFVDDSPIEREEVHISLPEVMVVDFPKDTSKLEQFIKEIAEKYFVSLTETEEDLNKTELYKNEFKRNEIKSQYVNLDEYILSLNINIKLQKLTDDSITRTVQLIQKTNQFNLTTIRYSQNDITVMSKDPKIDIYTVFVTDRFGDSGLVSVVIVKTSKNVAEIDTFLMSCRVMGRGIEDCIVDYIENHYFAGGFTEIKSRYVPTPKNAPVAKLYECMGYTLLSMDAAGIKTYALSSKAKPDRKLLCKIHE